MNPPNTEKSTHEIFEEKTEPAIGKHMHERFQEMRDAGCLEFPPEPAKAEAEEEHNCGNPDCPVHGKNRGEMVVLPPEVLADMKKMFENVKISNVEHETCIYVTDGEHSFKVYEMDDVEPLLVAYCEKHKLDKGNFTATASPDRDYRGALQMLKNGDVRLIGEDEVTKLRVKIVRNDAQGLLIYLEEKKEDRYS